MTETVSSAPPHVATSTPLKPPRRRSPPGRGRWIDNWDPENTEQWENRRPCHRPPQPALVDLRRVPRLRRLAALERRRRGAARRRASTSAPARSSGSSRSRASWAPPSASRTRSSCRSSAAATGPSSRPALLLIPSIVLAVCVSNPETPFGVLLARSGARGLRRRQLRELDVEHHLLLPAEGEGLGARPQRRRRQPRCIRRPVRRADRHHDRRRRRAEPARSPAGSGSRSSCVAMFGAFRYMDNLSNAKADFAGSAAALREPHLWIMSAALHRHLRLVHRLRERVPEAHRRPVPRVLGDRASAARRSRLAFLGALVGSLARPYGGRLSDRFGGARITMVAFAAMGIDHPRRLLTLPVANFWLFLGLFLLLFAAAGIGNGSTYRMVPIVFALRAGRATTTCPRKRQGGSRPRPDLGDRRLRRLPHPAGAEPLVPGHGRLRRARSSASSRDTPCSSRSPTSCTCARPASASTRSESRPDDPSRPLALPVLRPAVRDDPHPDGCRGCRDPARDGRRPRLPHESRRTVQEGLDLGGAAPRTLPPRRPARAGRRRRVPRGELGRRARPRRGVAARHPLGARRRRGRRVRRRRAHEREGLPARQVRAARARHEPHRLQRPLLHVVGRGGRQPRVRDRPRAAVPARGPRRGLHDPAPRHQRRRDDAALHRAPRGRAGRGRARRRRPASHRDRAAHRRRAGPARAARSRHRPRPAARASSTS